MTSPLALDRILGRSTESICDSNRRKILHVLVDQMLCSVFSGGKKEGTFEPV